jgi:HEAT repeat protein
MEAAKSLGKIGPGAKAAIASLTKTLRDKESGVREEAAKSLGDIDMRAAVGALSLAMKDQRVGIRISASAILAQLSPQHMGEVVSVLIDAVLDPDPDIRWDAATALGEIGPGARAAWAFLIDALEDDDQEVRRAVARALKKIDPDAAKRASVP